mgnify:FL=1
MPEETSAVKVGFVALGCSKNQVDAELMMGALKQAGFEISSDPDECEVVVINTCAFIESAKAESIQNVLEFCRKKESGNPKVVVVTGCLAERYREQVAELIPEADVVLGIGANDEIVSSVKKALKGEKVSKFYAPENVPLKGYRILANAPFMAYIRIAEGCDNRCTYCAIPMIRGRFHSRPMEDIVEEVQAFAAKGVREFNIIAQDTTRYGEDLYGERKLPELLEKLCAVDGVKWIRILYAYPERITDELLDVIAKENKIVKYLDIPYQHCKEEILRNMNRTGSMMEILAQLKHIREKVPGITLRTTLLVGFPGETEQDFDSLGVFVKAARFDRLGCFAYSREEGTPAADFPDQVEDEVKERRAETIMAFQADISRTLLKKQVGGIREVVVENYDPLHKMFIGRSAENAPEIDGRIYFTSPFRHKLGDFVSVKIDQSSDYDLCGSLVADIPESEA